MTDGTLLEQKVVVYDKPGQKGVVYSTVYTEGQARQAITHARTRGRQNVRSMIAKDHYREFSR